MRSFVDVVTDLLDLSAKREHPAVNMHIIVVTAERVTPTCAHVSTNTLGIFVSCESHQVCHAIVKTASLLHLGSEDKKQPGNQIPQKFFFSNLLVL